MKIKRQDKLMIILGKDKGKTGTVMAVLPAQNKIVVENLNIIKRHTKPSQKQPRGGILEIAKPIDISKVMVLDPASGKPARIGYEFKADGTKERIFKVSPNHDKRTRKDEKTEKSDQSAKKVTAPKKKQATAAKGEPTGDKK
jgi:large subunit ribosomal protein L24